MKSWPVPANFVAAMEPASGSPALLYFELLMHDRHAGLASSISGKCLLLNRNAAPKLRVKRTRRPKQMSDKGKNTAATDSTFSGLGPMLA
jgi:hypothetical protein